MSPWTFLEAHNGKFFHKRTKKYRRIGHLEGSLNVCNVEKIKS
jgi:hypothetical protein